MGQMTEILEHAYPVLPVLVLEDPEQALPLAEALLRGGLAVLELTLRTPQAVESLWRIRQQLPEVVVGAGTVLDAQQARQAQQAGAAFVVSPGFSPQMAQTTRELDMPWLPGVQTASEVMQAREAGLRQLKLFPAATAGLALLDNFAGPFPDVSFCPTGGIGPDNLATYLQRRNVSCCGGSWLAPRALVEARDWAGITALAREAVAIAGQSAERSQAGF